MQDIDTLEGFEPFVRRRFRSEKTPYVTIQRRGTVSLNAAAFTDLGQPKSVELLYNAARNIIAFRPISPTEKRGVPVRAFGEGQHSYILSAVTFLKDCDVDLSRSRRFQALPKHGALLIDLNSEGDDVSGRLRRSRPGDQEPKRERDRSGMFISSSHPDDSSSHGSRNDNTIGSAEGNADLGERDEEAKKLLADTLAQLGAGKPTEDLLESLQRQLQKFARINASRR